MRTEEFRHFLEDSERIESKYKAVNLRISKANTAETIIGEDLDTVVSNDNLMYNALLKIRSDSRERGGNIQNALRWYYRFVNGKSFPRMDAFRYSMHKKKCTRALGQIPNARVHS